MLHGERLRAIVMLQTGRSQRGVANTFSVSKSLISRLWKRYQQTQSVEDRPRSRRPRATPVEQGHCAWIVNAHLQHHTICRIPWPAMSPDLSPIEHVWDIIGICVRQRQRAPTTLAELGQVLQDEWNRVPQTAIGRTIHSMPRRLNECLTNFTSDPNRPSRSLVS